VAITVGYIKMEITEPVPLMFLHNEVYTEHTWWNNPRKPYDCEANEIIWLQADGKELEYIKMYFSNLPIVCPGTCIWKGEIANFIHINLKHLTQ
jgi:hypothetical protein